MPTGKVNDSNLIEIFGMDNLAHSQVGEAGSAQHHGAHFIRNSGLMQGFLS